MFSIYFVAYFLNPLENTECIEGENICFVCEVIDQNEASVWLKDDTQIPINGTYVISKQGQFHKLEIPYTIQLDDGDYSMHIHRTSRKATLKVHGQVIC